MPSDSTRIAEEFSRAFFGHSRVAPVALVIAELDRPFYLLEVARRSGTPPSATSVVFHRLERLTLIRPAEAGLVERPPRGRPGRHFVRSDSVFWACLPQLFAEYEAANRR
jgi:hypothetical protein